MQEQLAWADGLFAVGGRVTATSFLLSLKSVAIGGTNATSFVLHASSVREESCAGASFSNSPAVLHSGPGPYFLCSHLLSFLNTGSLCSHPRSFLAPRAKKIEEASVVSWLRQFAITVMLLMLGRRCVANCS